MASGAKPAMGKDERHPMSGTITLSIESPALNISGELQDASPAGFRVAHDCVLLQPGAVACLRYANLEKKVSVVWVRSFGNRVESGLLHYETNLVQRTLHGDGSAFAELLAPHIQALNRAVHSILPNRADADEAMQEALLKALLHLSSFHPGSDFMPWLYRIATREAFKYRRWNNRHLYGLVYLESEDDSEQDLLSQIAASNRSPSEMLERKEFETAITASLNALNPIYREIFVACDLQQSPVIEAARLLGINVDTANTRLHRARLLMRKQLRGIQP